MTVIDSHSRRIKHVAERANTYREQITYLRNLEPPSDPAFLLQLVLILAVATTAYVMLGVWEAVVWGVAYVAMQLAEKAVVRWVPEDANKKQYAFVLFVLAVESSVYCAMPVYLWFYGTDVAKLAAAVLMTASAMHTTHNRAAFPSILACFLVPNATIVLTISIAAGMSDPTSMEQVVYLALGSAMALFFVVMFVQAYQKEARTRGTEVALSQAQKLETLGKLTGGIAHDFNNLISVVSGNLQLIKDAESLNEAKAYADSAHTAASASAELTSKMLAFGRKAPLYPKAVHVDAVFNDLNEFADRIVPKHIDLTFQTSPGTRAIFVDMNMMQNALLNLVINASDAMPTGGDLIVSARNHSEEDVVIEVRDNGPGIPAQIKARVEEPFFTTKENIGRSGMGLSMVQGFVEQSNGNMELDSVEGKGTTVALYFPAARTRDTKPTETDGADLAPAQVTGGRIMLVDDNAQLVKTITIKLEKDGHVVASFLTGDDAVTALERGDIPDLLITDAVMPGDTQGTDLIKKLRVMSPNTPTILMSGYAETELGAGFLQEQADRFMTKPVSLRDLSDTISSLLTPIRSRQ